MGIRKQIANVVKEIDQSYGRKPIKLDHKARNEEYAKTKTGTKTQAFVNAFYKSDNYEKCMNNMYNVIKMSNSYAEAKQHNLV